MEVYNEGNGVYKIITHSSSIHLKSFEILELAQQVIADYYPNADLDLEDYLINKEQLFEKQLLSFEAVPQNQNESLIRQGVTLYRYIPNEDTMVELTEFEINEGAYKYELLYRKK